MYCLAEVKLFEAGALGLVVSLGILAGGGPSLRALVTGLVVALCCALVSGLREVGR